MVTNSKTLDKLGRQKEINEYVRLILDMLPTNRKDFARGDNDLQNLDFWQFIEALRKSDLKSDRNLILLGGKQNLNPTKREKYKRNI